MSNGPANPRRLPGVPERLTHAIGEASFLADRYRGQSPSSKLVLLTYFAWKGDFALTVRITGLARASVIRYLSFWCKAQEEERARSVAAA